MYFIPSKEIFVELQVNAINPIVLAPVKTKWVSAGSSLSLAAELASTAGNITWFLNDKLLSADPRVNITGNGNNVNLTIDNITSMDAGVLKLQTKTGNLFIIYCSYFEACFEIKSFLNVETKKEKSINCN
jgi:hypothetical protein